MNADLISDYLQNILDCACRALNEGICGEQADCPCPCRAFVSAGPPVWDLAACCSDGQISSHSERIYPYGKFPSQASGVNICQTPLATDIVVTLLRCWPAVVKEDGSAPSGPEIEDASFSIYRDQYVLTKGILCCLAAKGKSQLFVFQGSKILPPSGGCIGVEVRFTVELMDPLP